jgi:hypothetical protein
MDPNARVMSIVTWISEVFIRRGRYHRHLFRLVALV